MPESEREKLDSLDARIHQAETKVGEKAADNTAAAPMKMSRIGFDFMSAVLGCVLVGWFADRAFGTMPWGIIIMVVVGFAIGIINLWKALASPKPE